MSFIQEIKDFANAFESGSTIMERRNQRKRDEKNDEVRNRHTEAVTDRIKALQPYEITSQELMNESRRIDNEYAPRRYDSALESAEMDRLYKAYDLVNPDDDKYRDKREEVDAYTGRGSGGGGGGSMTGGGGGDASYGGGSMTPGVELSSYQGGSGRRGGRVSYDTAQALYETSGELGVNPIELAGLINYESAGTWNPDKWGGKNGNYVGLIQMGGPERRQYGWKPGMTQAEYIRGPMKSYLVDRGLKPGMGIDHMYSIVNAGSLNRDGTPRYGASDGNGTVRTHIDKIRGEHIPAAAKLFEPYIRPRREEPTVAAASGGLIRDPSDDEPAALRYAREARRRRMAVPVEEEEVAPAASAPAPRQAIPAPAYAAEEAPARVPVPTERPAAEPQAAIPVPTERPQGGAAPAEVPSEVTSPQSETSGASRGGPPTGSGGLVAAVRDGLLYSLDQLGLKTGTAVQDPERGARMAAYLKGHGAAPPSLIETARQKVDPNNELSESERNTLALSSVYDFYVSRGQPEKAQATAGAMLQHYRKLFNQWTAVTQAAVQAGDIDGAAEAAVRAYANIPDGRDVTVAKQGENYVVTFTDEETGKEVNQTLVSPREMTAFAMGMSPTGFDEFLMNAAGEKAAASKGPSETFQAAAIAIDNGEEVPASVYAGLELEEQRELRARVKAREDAKNGGEGGGGKPYTPGDIRAAREEVTGTFEAMLAETDEETGANPYAYLGDFKGPERRTAENAAVDIMDNTANRENGRNIAADEALEVVGAVTHVSPENPELRPFEVVTDDPEKKLVVIRIGEGEEAAEYGISTARFKDLDSIWARKADKLRAEIEKKNQPSPLAAIPGAVGVVVDGARRSFQETTGIGDERPTLGEAVGGAIGGGNVGPYKPAPGRPATPFRMPQSPTPDEQRAAIQGGARAAGAAIGAAGEEASRRLQASPSQDEQRAIIVDGVSATTSRLRSLLGLE